MSEYPNLLSPLKIGSVTVRNRVLVSAHVPGFAENNRAGKTYVDYHRRYASNGVGLQITGGTPIHRSGMLSLAPDGLWNLDDGVIPGYQALARAVHDDGGRILAQLAHSAGTVRIDRAGFESWSASPIRSCTSGNISHEMTAGQVREVMQAYVEGARRVVEGGLDGIEILAAYGFLPHAFLSPLTNWRNDDYGGSLDNRIRFLVDLLGEVRKVTGDDFILGARLPGDEFEPGGLVLADMERVCKRLSDLGLVDYINVTAHTNFSHTGRSKHWAPTPATHGLFVPLAEAIRKVVDVPVFTVGRVVDPMHAEQIIAAGKADMVGMTRAHICDPEIVRKIKNNEAARIRPCVGANTCIANRYAGKPISCMHNPLVPPFLANRSAVTGPGRNKGRKVVVVGAGPAGLEAARGIAEAGHSVSLYEASATPGGQLALWASCRSTRELTGILDWRLAELERLGVPIHLDSPLQRSSLQSMDCDSVIMATGATARPSRLVHNGRNRVFAPHAVIRDPEILARNALVISEGRGQAALVVAEILLDRGARVELVTSDFAIAADLDPTVRDGWYERLGKRGVVMTSQNIVQEIGETTVSLQNIHSGVVTNREDIDLLVDWCGSRVEDSMLRERWSVKNDLEWHAIGDCIAPRTLEVAIAEAVQVAQAL